jgi:DNA-binding transcriptional ArsR family regulator
VGDVFKALADPTRRALLDELLDRDGQTLFELCARLAGRHGLGSTRQAVSQHLDVLEDAGLVNTRRQGRYKIHHLDTSPLQVVVERWLSGPGNRAPGHEPPEHQPEEDKP